MHFFRNFRCTEARKNSKYKHEGNFYKLLSNSLYGKLLENKRARTYVRIVKSVDKLGVYSSRPNFQSRRIIGEDLVLAFLDQQRVTLDSVIQASFSVLEYSKALVSK